MPLYRRVTLSAPTVEDCAAPNKFVGIRTRNSKARCRLKRRRYECNPRTWTTLASLYWHLNVCGLSFSRDARVSSCSPRLGRERAPVPASRC